MTTLWQVNLLCIWSLLVTPSWLNLTLEPVITVVNRGHIHGQMSYFFWSRYFNNRPCLRFNERLESEKKKIMLAQSIIEHRTLFAWRLEHEGMMKPNGPSVLMTLCLSLNSRKVQVMSHNLWVINNDSIILTKILDVIHRWLNECLSGVVDTY